MDRKQRIKDFIIVMALGLPILFAGNYVAALFGAPASLWSMRMLGLM